MPPRWKPIAQLWAETRAKGKLHSSELIYRELTQYALDHQFYPVMMTLYHWMCDPRWNPATLTLDPPRYPCITEGSFRHWFTRLVEAHLIEQDAEGSSRAIRADTLQIVERFSESRDHAIAEDIERALLKDLDSD
jgi:hypothetical protein